MAKTATKSTTRTTTTKAKTLKSSDRALKRAAQKLAEEQAAAEQLAKNQAWRKARRQRKALEKKRVPLRPGELKHLEELRGLQNTGRLDRNGRTMLQHYEIRQGGPRSKAPSASTMPKATVRVEVAEAAAQPTFVGALQVLLDAARVAGDAKRVADLEMALRMVGATK